MTYHTSVLALLTVWIAGHAAAGVCTQSTPMVDAFDSGTRGFFVGPLRVRSTAVPEVGEPWSALVTCGQPGAHGCLMFDLQTSPIPLPQFGATLHLSDPAAAVPFTFDSNGDSPPMLTSSAAPASLAGIPMYLQAAALDPSAMGDATISNPLEVRFGTSMVGRPLLYLARSRMDPDGTLRGLIDGYAIGPAGGLTQVPGAPYPLGVNQTGYLTDRLAVTPDQRTLVTTSELSGEIWSFSIEPDGSLVPSPDSPIMVNFSPRAVEASDTHVFVCTFLGEIHSFVRGADSTLTFGSTIQSVRTEELVHARGGSRLYAMGLVTMSSFEVSPSGQLSMNGTQAFTLGPANSVEIAPDGSRLYVGGYAAAGSIDLHVKALRVLGNGELLDPEDLYLPGVPSPTASRGLMRLQVSPDGNRVYGAVAGSLLTPDSLVITDVSRCNMVDERPPIPVDLAGNASLGLSSDGSLLFLGSDGGGGVPGSIVGYRVLDNGDVVPTGTSVVFDAPEDRRAHGIEVLL